MCAGLSRKCLWCQTLTYKLLDRTVETKELPSHFPLNSKEDTATFFLMLRYRSTCLHEETDIAFWSGNLFQYVLNKIFHLRKVSNFSSSFCRNILFNIQWKVSNFSSDFHSPCFQKIALCSRNYLNATIVVKLLHTKLCRKNLKHS